ncbi:cytochrome b5 [Aaosphaeria arxii CBS 175.79]|uniref:Cytochrome b5 n=1 Tax=Aaosphaeria arxii CBS 175.79 TaxID=1450172 RepID=A0A6A5XDN1_9PLEO|nr:cytochrome b5 [Aaosphaeria arxii CBS 175.79]KAF2010926.1 cytochrome b5 [Aaosphaeria arxii CBS 175.79]
MSSARYRPNASRPSDSPSDSPSSTTKNVATTTEEDDRRNKFTILDALRVLAGVLILSCGTSYLATSGSSLTWGYNPWWTRAREWKGLLRGTVHLTDAQLATYDGTDPSLPIYLALNGTIYDVSSSPGTYGPGGSYHFFAGRDAARAFLTGCFAEDQTPDLRGVELMYMPIDPEPGHPDYKEPGERRELSKGERKNRHARELREARRRVREGLEHWHTLFRGDKGKPYRRVGEVVREEGWLEKLEKRELCEEARKARPVRKDL